MFVRRLTQFRKTANAILTLSLIVAVFFFILAYAAGKVDKQYDELFLLFLLLGGISIAIGIVSATIGGVSHSRFFIKYNAPFVLELNTVRTEEEIKSHKQIEYAGNLLVIDGKSVEIDRYEAYRLLTEYRKQISRLDLVQKKSRLVDQDPVSALKEFFGALSV